MKTTNPSTTLSGLLTKTRLKTVNVEPGFKTVTEYARDEGKSIGRMTVIIGELMASNPPALEKKKFLRVGTDGVSRNLAHYRPRT